MNASQRLIAGGAITASTFHRRTFVPNGDATPEAGESAARETQENSGRVPTIP